MEIFRKVDINIPLNTLIDALQQTRNYVKFLNDVLAKKRELEDSRRYEIWSALFLIIYLRTIYEIWGQASINDSISLQKVGNRNHQATNDRPPNDE